MNASLDEIDRAIIGATETGLPLTPRPYETVAAAIGVDGETVRTRMRNMLVNGVIRRIGAVPNHYVLGLVANGMTVWDVSDDQAHNLGSAVGELDFVSHAYLRPRHEPDWPYNLFAMVHGSTRDEVEAKAGEIRVMLGAACRARDVLYSTAILKKTGFRSKA